MIYAIIAIIAAVLTVVVKAACKTSWATATKHVGSYALGALALTAVAHLTNLPLWAGTIVGVVIGDAVARRVAPLPSPFAAR